MQSHDTNIMSALALTATTMRRGLDLRWLAQSHRDPRLFHRSLFDALAGLSNPGPKSEPGRGYDLYHDLVVRHCGAGLSALQVCEAGARHGHSRWRTLSYDQLHNRCSSLASAWLELGVQPGSSVCVMLPFTEKAIVALLTGLRLGATITLLEPLGPDYLTRRLEALGPEFIVTEHFHKARLPDPDALGVTWLCEQTAAGSGHSASHTYLPEDDCARLFSPLRRAPHIPTPVSAELAYLGALRDGAVTMALRPGDRLAAPGFDTLQHQPALLFAALMVGATYVHVEFDMLLDEPSLLSQLRLRSVGISVALREALLEAELNPRPPWDHVFKNPDEPMDWEAWRDFIELLELDDTSMSNVLLEAASGGTLLSSPRRPAAQALAHLMDVSPAAGRSWSLLDFNGSGQSALGQAGIFAGHAGMDPGDPGEPVEPDYVVLGHRRRYEYLHGGPLEPRRSGRVYPADEVLAGLSDCPFLQATSIVALSGGGPAPSFRFVLLAFTGGEDGAQFEALAEARIDELQRILRVRLSPGHLPDHIELTRGFARLRDGEVDHAWCRDQYLAGTLHRKHHSSVFHRLAALRELLAPAGDA